MSKLFPRPNKKENVVSLDVKISTLLNEGYYPLEKNFSFEKTINSFELKQYSFFHELERFGEVLARTLSNNTPEDVFTKFLRVTFDREIKYRGSKILDFFLEKEQDKYELDEYIILRDNERIDILIIEKVISYLGSPNLSIIHLAQDRTFMKKDSFCDFSVLEDGDKVILYWERGASLEYDNGDFGGTILKLKDFDLLQNAVSNFVLRMDGKRIRSGKMSQTFPLESFHKEARELTDKIKHRKSAKILVRGATGTCKSQWSRSFAQQILPDYMVILMSPEELDLDNIPDYVKKVCVIVDEFQAGNRRDTNYSKNTNKYLRIFDDTAFEDYEKEIETDIFWIFTSNFENDEDYDPAMLRRLDYDFTFTLNSNNEKVNEHL